MRIRSLLLGIAVSATALLAPTVAQAAPGGSVAAVDLTGLTSAIADRLALADTVAASKWASGAAIDDPAREQVVLDSVTLLAAERELDPAYVRMVFRDQIEASKTVQRGLFAVWSSPGGVPPAGSPDLGPVRTAINALNVEIVDQLAAQEAILSGSLCLPGLAGSTVTTIAAKQFDPLHIAGLIQAESSLCDAP
ncbi:gamma subclass chorismate mutase AroQ [Gordonia rubripertincta]|uniref:chorismate mutase n=1 Tax=Gordonia rubripertincta TaxID=36822 RepID=A0ABT4MVV5_GORRU|nr:gamma subclass chorismate mutase AroQ [Gordonia rubripertincta]MCZ4551135.1 gamma subclass chorismate mutase AroQ [Gordonia rubripertincta]